MAEIDDTQSTIPPHPEILAGAIVEAGRNLSARGQIPPVAVTLAAALGMAAGRCDMRWCEHNARGSGAAGAAGDVRLEPEKSVE